MNSFKYLLLLCCLMATTTHVHAGLLPDTTINHQVPTSFTVDKRIVLNAQIEDGKGVTDARCYFKADPDNNYLYVSMHELAETSFKCTLPAFGSGVETVEYFFLTVNGNGQVIRSTPYHIPESNIVAATGDQIAVPASGQLEVYSELGDSEIENTSISDPRVLLMPAERLYGLRAGVYSLADIPDSLNVMQGFFGGFILNPVDNTVKPVQGAAPGLKPPTTKQSPAAGSFSEKSTTRAATEPVNIAGNNWTGYFFRSDDSNNKINLTASIRQNGSYVSITTSKSGLGHYLQGTTTPNGDMLDMLVYDSYDDEDWTTFYGPASYTQVKIYDYAWPPEAGEPVPPLNAITLYRPPLPPLEVKASDGTFEDKVAVNWNFSAGATSYLIYDCGSNSTNDCRQLAAIDSNHYDDARETHGKVYYRVKACDGLCSNYSSYDTGYLALRATMAPILFLLLL